jgi:hypothetical protein
MLFWVWLASGPIKMRQDSAGGRAKTGNRAKSQNAAKQTPGALHKIARHRKISLPVVYEVHAIEYKTNRSGSRVNAYVKLAS